jgi:aspartate kinase
MAINKSGHNAISFTGSQSGIITDDRHSDARIIEVRPFRIQDELSRGRIVIVAGFQGMSYKREITTLGRGGSDTTAVALAAALDAESCEICGDVDGVYSADPHLVEEARHIPVLGYSEMQEMSESGARVLNAAAVEFAKERGIALMVRRTDGQGSHTLVRKDPPRTPGVVVGITHEESVTVISSDGRDSALDDALLGFLDEQNISAKQLSIHRLGPGSATAVVVSREFRPDPPACRKLIDDRFGGSVELTDDLGAVSLIGAAINQNFKNLRQAEATLAQAAMQPAWVHTSSFRITVLIPAQQVHQAVRVLHEEFIG